MKKEEIKRMNDLYHLSQERDLSEEEFAEWEGLKKAVCRRFQGEPYSPARQYICNRRQRQQAQAREEVGRQVICADTKTKE